MIDWAAKWFEIRAEMGQSDQVTMMYQDEGDNWVKIHFHHRQTDGFGKMQSLLKDEGLSVTAPSRDLKKPSWLSQPYWLLKGLQLHPKLQSNPWKYYNSTLPSSHPDDVCAWFLSETETAQLTVRARDRGLNTGFYILSEMDRILRLHLFRDPNHSSTWLCPVDVRGAFKNPSLDRNWVSFVATQFKGRWSPSSVSSAFQAYKKSLKNKDYWANWELYQIGKYIGINGMKRLAQKAHNKSFWMGSFSDLGSWNQEALKNSRVRARRWVMAPPGSPSYPIGLTTLEWCGRRTITLKIHPAITNQNHVELAPEIMSEFKNQVLVTPAKP